MRQALNRCLAALLALAGLAVAPAPASAALQAENLLASMPPGFKLGYSDHQNGMDMQEWVPKGETVDNWSAMITVQIFHRLGGVRPMALVDRIAAGWRSACPGGAANGVQDGAENGYSFTLWALTCPLNPQTGKPENAWEKAIGGADALYSVQYAYRKPLTKALEIPAAGFLRKVQVCDTRRADRPCPRGL